MSKSISTRTISLRPIITDLSLWALIVSNGITIAEAIHAEWNLVVILWIYCFQSLSIGVVNIIRMITSKKLSLSGEADEDLGRSLFGNKQFMVMLFISHYGVFHYAYMRMLLQGELTMGEVVTLTQSEWHSVILFSSMFFINHLFGYFHTRAKESKQLNLKKSMFFPYLRVLPMHFTALLGGGAPLFLLLKTMADVAMHIVERWFLNKPGQRHFENT